MDLQALCSGGMFAPAKVAAHLRTTSGEIAETLGLSKDALQRKDRIAAPKTQTRIREMTEILTKVEPRFGSALMAYAWYRSQPLAGFGGRTAMTLVREGKATAVLDYLDAVDDGVAA